MKLISTNGDTVTPLDPIHNSAAESNCDLIPTQQVQIATLIGTSEAEKDQWTASSMPSSSMSTAGSNLNTATREENKVHPEDLNLTKGESKQSHSIEAEQSEQSKQLMAEPSVFKMHENTTNVPKVGKENSDESAQNG